MKPANPRIQAVAFDFGGVLARFIEQSTLCHMADVAGVPTGVFSEALWSNRADYDCGKLDGDTYWEAVLAACGSNTPRGATAELLLELDAVGWSRINIATLRWARILKQNRYRTLIVSNMASSTYEMVIRGQSWLKHFDYVVISGWIGVNKPDPAIFHKAISDIDLQPHEVLFVDDLPANVAGARAAGLHALRFIDAASLAAELSDRYPAIPTEGLLCRA